MREGPNATLKLDVKTLTGGNWTKLLDTNVQRTYLMIQNSYDSHTIEIGFGTDTVAPTHGFKLKGAVSGHKRGATTFQFNCAPSNAVWAKADDTHPPDIEGVHDY